MKKLRLFFMLVFLVPFFCNGQIKIANQKIYLGESVLRLVTYEKTSEGYKNVLSIVRHDTALDDSIDTFFVETLEPVEFHNELAAAIEGLLGNDSLSSENPYGSKMTSAYAKVAIGATMTDHRPIAGRLVLSENILGYNKDVFSKKKPDDEGCSADRCVPQNYLLRWLIGNNPKCKCKPKCGNKAERVRYFLGKRKFPEYVEARELALSSYENENNGLSGLLLAKINADGELGGLVKRERNLEENLIKITQEINKIDKDWADFEPVKTKALADRLPLVRDSIKIIDSLIFLLLKVDKVSGIDTIIEYDANVALFSLANHYREEEKRLEELRDKDLSYRGIMYLRGIHETSWNSTFKVLEQVSKLIEIRRKNLGLTNEEIRYAKSRIDSSFFYIGVDSVQIEFNQGMIERIVATTHKKSALGSNSKGEQMIFTNVYPIGFSTFRNYKITIQTQMLVERTSNYMIPLSELISYIPNCRLNTRDFSPLDTVITFLPQDREFDLHKPARSEIIQAKVFTDFVGLDENEPNGLVQTEIEKRINLYTWRRPLFGGSFLNTAFAQFATPVFTLSKVDSKLRRLKLSDYNNPAIVPNSQQKYVSTLELLQYENLSAGLDFNIGLLDSQPWKATFFLNAGFRFGRVAFSDSLKVSDSLSVRLPDFGASTFRWFPEFRFTAFPEEYFSFSIAYRPSLLVLMNEDVLQVPSQNSIEAFGMNASNRSRWINTFELSASIPFSEHGEFYARYRFNYLANNWKTNFHQAQFGVSVSLTKALTSN